MRDWGGRSRAMGVREYRRRRSGIVREGQGGKKSTWPPASGMSAVSRLVAIHYPGLLKYYAHWLMLTVWPEGGECVGKRVCLHSAALQPSDPSPANDAAHFWSTCLREVFKINKERRNYCWAFFVSWWLLLLGDEGMQDTMNMSARSVNNYWQVVLYSKLSYDDRHLCH